MFETVKKTKMMRKLKARSTSVTIFSQGTTAASGTMASITGNHNTQTDTIASIQDTIVLQGYLKKFKKLKRRYFVLFADSRTRPASLVYYKNEQKFKQHPNSPKKSVVLKNCFNINRRTDVKYKNVIALYLNDEQFCIVLETEEELTKWLQALLELQRGEKIEGEPPKPKFGEYTHLFMFI